MEKIRNSMGKDHGKSKDRVERSPGGQKFDSKVCALPKRDKMNMLIEFAHRHMKYDEVEGWFGPSFPNPNPNITDWLMYAINLDESVSKAIAEEVNSKEFFHIAIEETKVKYNISADPRLEFNLDYIKRKSNEATVIKIHDMAKAKLSKLLNYQFCHQKLHKITGHSSFSVNTSTLEKVNVAPSPFVPPIIEDKNPSTIATGYWMANSTYFRVEKVHGVLSVGQSVGMTTMNDENHSIVVSYGKITKQIEGIVGGKGTYLFSRPKTRTHTEIIKNSETYNLTSSFEFFRGEPVVAACSKLILRFDSRVMSAVAKDEDFQFFLERCSNDGTNCVLTDWNGRRKEYLDHGLKPSTSYRYRIAFWNDFDRSDYYSNIYSITTGTTGYATMCIQREIFLTGLQLTFYLSIALAVIFAPILFLKFTSERTRKDLYRDITVPIVQTKIRMKRTLHMMISYFKLLIGLDIKSPTQSNFSFLDYNIDSLETSHSTLGIFLRNMSSGSRDSDVSDSENLEVPEDNDSADKQIEVNVRDPDSIESKFQRIEYAKKVLYSSPIVSMIGSSVIVHKGRLSANQKVYKRSKEVATEPHNEYSNDFELMEETGENSRFEATFPAIIVGRWEGENNILEVEDEVHGQHVCQIKIGHVIVGDGIPKGSKVEEVFPNHYSKVLKVRLNQSLAPKDFNRIVSTTFISIYTESAEQTVSAQRKVSPTRRQSIFSSVVSTSENENLKEKYTHIINETDRMKVSKIISGRIQKGQIITRMGAKGLNVNELVSTRPIKYPDDLYEQDEPYFDKVLVKRQLHGQAHFKATWELGTNVMTVVLVTSGELFMDQVITGKGIPEGTKITSVPIVGINNHYTTSNNFEDSAVEPRGVSVLPGGIGSYEVSLVKIQENPSRFDGKFIKGSSFRRVMFCRCGYLFKEEEKYCVECGAKKSFGPDIFCERLDFVHPKVQVIQPDYNTKKIPTMCIKFHKNSFASKNSKKVPKVYKRGDDKPMRIKRHADYVDDVDTKGLTHRFKMMFSKSSVRPEVQDLHGKIHKAAPQGYHYNVDQLESVATLGGEEYNPVPLIDAYLEATLIDFGKCLRVRWVVEEADLGDAICSDSLDYFWSAFSKTAAVDCIYNDEQYPQKTLQVPQSVSLRLTDDLEHYLNIYRAESIIQAEYMHHDGNSATIRVAIPSYQDVHDISAIYFKDKHGVVVASHHPKVELALTNCKEITEVYRNQLSTRFVDINGEIIDPFSIDRHGSPGVTVLAYKVYGRSKDMVKKTEIYVNDILHAVGEVSHRHDPSETRVFSLNRIHSPERCTLPGAPGRLLACPAFFFPCFFWCGPILSCPVATAAGLSCQYDNFHLDEGIAKTCMACNECGMQVREGFYEMPPQLYHRDRKSLLLLQHELQRCVVKCKATNGVEYSAYIKYEDLPPPPQVKLVLNWPITCNITPIGQAKSWFQKTPIGEYLYPHKNDPDNLLAFKNNILIYAKSDHFWPKIKSVYLRESFGFFGIVKTYDTRLLEDTDTVKLPSIRYRRYKIPLYGNHKLSQYKIIFIVLDGREWTSAEIDSSKRTVEATQGGFFDWLNNELPILASLILEKVLFIASIAAVLFLVWFIWYLTYYTSTFYPILRDFLIKTNDLTIYLVMLIPHWLEEKLFIF